MLDAAIRLASTDPGLVLREGLGLALICAAILATFCLPGLT